MIQGRSSQTALIEVIRAFVRETESLEVQFDNDIPVTEGFYSRLVNDNQVLVGYHIVSTLMEEFRRKELNAMYKYMQAMAAAVGVNLPKTETRSDGAFLLDVPSDQDITVLYNAYVKQ